MITLLTRWHNATWVNSKQVGREVGPLNWGLGLPRTGCHLSMGSHCVICHPTDDRPGPAFTPTGQVGTRFIDLVSMKGWVGLVGWLHNEMVRRSHIPVLTGSDVAQLRWSRPTKPNRQPAKCFICFMLIINKYFNFCCFRALAYTKKVWYVYLFHRILNTTVRLIFTVHRLHYT